MTIYTDHALERMRVRRIKKAWVEEAIKNPDSVIHARQGKKQSIKKINGAEISVIYVEKSNHIVVITVFWGE